MYYNRLEIKSISLVLIFFLVLFLSSCKKNDNPVDSGDTVKYGTISGKVVEAVSGDPLAKVNIKTIPSTNSILTGDDGTFKIENVAPGEYKVSAGKISYDSSSVTIQVSSGNSSSADISLRKIDSLSIKTTGTLTGKVLNLTTNQPIPNAIITTLPATSSIIADEKGTYIIDKLAPGNYTVTAKKNGYQSASADILITRGKTTIADLVMKFTDTTSTTIPGKIEGIAHDVLGQGISGVNICTDPATSTVTTGASGSYSIDKVTPGKVKLTASKNGYTPVTLTVNVVSGLTVTADFELVSTSGTIEGTVTDDSTGRVISGVNIKTTPGTSTVTTDSYGKYRISNITPGVFTITAEKIGYGNGTASVTVKAGVVTNADMVMKKQQ
jgi:hypothetical protein